MPGSGPVAAVQLVPTLFLIAVMMFVLVRLLPGDPTAAFLGERANDADIARINAQLGLDQPIIGAVLAVPRSICAR